MARPPLHPAVALGAAALALLLAAPARAELGSLGDLTVGLAVQAGLQPDPRPCDTAGTSRTVPSTGQCVLFAGGVEGSFLWRGHIGAALGLFSVAGQAATIPDGQTGAGFPDRVSVPLLVDLRPLSFLLAENRGYLSRVLYGVRLAIGPSLEIVRTSSDSSIAWGQRIGSPARPLFGMHLSFDGEVPLSAAPAGLSVRFSVRVLYAPVVVLNDGAVQSGPVVTTDMTPANIATMFQGYATHAQIYLGLVYYL